MTASRPRRSPQPWSLKWISAVIMAFVIIYTAVNFYYRKPSPAYRPYQDAQDRATVARLLAAGWQKLPVTTRRPIEKISAPGPAPLHRAALGLGADFEPNFAEQPKLLATIDQVSAPAVVLREQDYPIFFTASLPNLKAQLGDSTLYRKGHELVLVPTIETLPGKDLRSRWPDSHYAVTFSTITLPRGRYEIRLVAKGPALAWSFTVK